ncbi:MAG: hypothetical protein LCH38_01805 [Proteobacteria bacterium]|nr:hypothetical protein [Pseudomonadota bacterium]
MASKPSLPPDPPRFLRHLRHARLALWEIYLILTIGLAIALTLGLKHWA